MVRSLGDKVPRIAESAFVSEAAYVIGDVEIGENSSVWPGAVIRGDFGKIRIGKNTAVEDNAVLHAGTAHGPVHDLTIGDNVHIGHGAVINCTRIGNHVLVGMNATLLHDTEIGEYCIIAAGCLVRDGAKIPDRSFVAGIPGQIKSEATPDQLWWVEQAPKQYLKMVKHYKQFDLESK
jgi:carbonic anhydrase/acetyltransferase-like protein (isoleucine patch superfamily)